MNMTHLLSIYTRSKHLRCQGTDTITRLASSDSGGLD